MTLKAVLRDASARLLFAAGVTRPGRRARGRLSIATFHRVLPREHRRAYPYPGLVVTPEELDAFLGYFVTHFDCGTLRSQHERHLRQEQGARPLMAITFDDGQHDNFAHARPVLRRYGVRASFFIPVAAVERQELLWHDRLGFALLGLLRQRGGRERALAALRAAGLPLGGPGSLPEIAVGESKALPLERRLRLVEELARAAGNERPPGFARLMSFAELAALAGDGHEIGSHSMTHCMVTECDDAALRYELAESRRALEERLRQPVDSFCYPNGNCDARSAAAAAAAGYQRAVTTDWGLNGPAADPFRLRRCDMDAGRVTGTTGMLPALLAFRMSGLYPGLG